MFGTIVPLQEPRDYSASVTEITPYTSEQHQMA